MTFMIERNLVNLENREVVSDVLESFKRSYDENDNFIIRLAANVL